MKLYFFNIVAHIEAKWEIAHYDNISFYPELLNVRFVEMRL